MVEGARLESVYRGDSIVGSNPTVSATYSALNGKRAELRLGSALDVSLAKAIEKAAEACALTLEGKDPRVESKR